MFLSSIIWHKRLGHISKQRIKRLIKYEIFPDLDFSYFDTCVDCIKGKLAAKVRGLPRLIDALSCLGLFIQIFVGH